MLGMYLEKSQMDENHIHVLIDGNKNALSKYAINLLKDCQGVKSIIYVTSKLEGIPKLNLTKLLMRNPKDSSMRFSLERVHVMDSYPGTRYSDYIFVLKK